ncbi:erythromycin esterase family protein [Streptomyces phytohabitans]|uniref:erythromycin esterase family protein n=1 Tax=Streptomyces phytohabitans TaxID=1150371 RepID=UPI00345BF93D
MSRRPYARRRLTRPRARTGVALAAAALAGVALLPLGGGPPDARATGDGAPVAALERHARPLGDLDSLVRRVGGARVVGVGEASHSGHEFFVLKQRLFRKLVAERGFTTFALEASWSTGLRLDAYVTRGVGDPERIMRDEFQGQYVFWNTREYLDLVRWMRRHNLDHPGRPPLRFVGSDLGYPGPEAFDEVTSYVTAHRPELAERVDGLYAGLRPDAGTEAGGWMAGQLAKDLAVRRAEARRATRALDLLRAADRPEGAEGRSYDWAVRNALAVTQSFTGYAFPDEEFAERMRYRDRVLAANTAWWLRRSGGKVLLAANNGHVAYEATSAEFPVPTGAFLRERLGAEYVNVGLTFGRGRINALPDPAAREPETYAVPPAPAGYGEHTLDRVRRRDLVLDLRTATGAARAWLEAPRPVRSYGLYWSAEAPVTDLAASYDVLVHLRRVTAAHLR